MSDVIGELSWRGLIAQSTDLDVLRAALGSGPVTFYAGFDPTGPGLHIGHLAVMLTPCAGCSGRGTGCRRMGGPRGSAGGPGELPSVASLMVSAGVVPTRSAAKRAIAEGGAYLNNRRIASADAVPAEYDLLHGRYLTLRRGKRTVGAVEVVRERPYPMFHRRSGGLCGGYGWFARGRRRLI